MEPFDYKKENTDPEKKKSAIVFSKSIRAGNRTYFFDVRSTRNNEYYLTLTESKKKFDPNGNFQYQKHKIFLYPEDFDKFRHAFDETLDYIFKNQPAFDRQEGASVMEQREGLELNPKGHKEEELFDESFDAIDEKSFSDVDFDDI